jgi:cytochrome c-type biogenesis protein CcmE
MNKINNKKKRRYAVVVFAAAHCVLLVYIYIYSLNGPL